MDIEKIKASIERQIENPDWDKIKALAEEKLKHLAGLISEEGALHIAVKEMYPDIEYNASPARASGTTLKGRLINKTKPRSVKPKDPKKSPILVRDVFIATEDTGVMQSTTWGKRNVELFTNIEHGNAIQLSDVKIGNKDGETVLNIFDNSTVEKVGDKDVKPLQDMLEPIETQAVVKSKIGTMEAVIIQVKDILFNKCPVCGSKLSETEGTFLCPTHQEVKPDRNHGKELTIDNGKGPMSTVLWQDILKEGDDPKPLDKITCVCRVYDCNYFQREKARQDSDTPDDVLAKQYPKDLRLSVYNYNIEQMKAGAATSAKRTDNTKAVEGSDSTGTVPIEQVEDVPKK